MLSVLVGVMNRLSIVKEGWLAIADKLGDCYQSAYQDNHAAFVAAEVREQQEIEFAINALTVISLGSMSMVSTAAKPRLMGKINKDSAVYPKIELFTEGLEDGLQVAVDKTLGSGAMPALKSIAGNSSAKQTYKICLKPNNGSYKTDLKNYIRDEFRSAAAYIEDWRSKLNDLPLSHFEGASHTSFERLINSKLNDDAAKNDAGHTGALLLKDNDFRQWDWTGMRKALSQAMLVAYSQAAATHGAPPPEVVGRMKDIQLLAKFGIHPHSSRSLLFKKIYLLPIKGSTGPGIPTWNDTVAKLKTWQPPAVFKKLAMLLPPAGKV